MGQVAVPETDEDGAYSALRQRTLDAAMFDEPQFVVEHHASRPTRSTLSELLEANRDDADVVDWLKRARIGGSLVVGGGAAPAISLRRIS